MEAVKGVHSKSQKAKYAAKIGELDDSQLINKERKYEAAYIRSKTALRASSFAGGAAIAASAGMATPVVAVTVGVSALTLNSRINKYNIIAAEMMRRDLARVPLTRGERVTQYVVGAAGSLPSIACSLTAGDILFERILDEGAAAVSGSECLDTAIDEVHADIMANPVEATAMGVAWAAPIVGDHLHPDPVAADKRGKKTQCS
ncbi:hypothetical protein OC835_004340 [Tilletia horrida]|nr:hypothetical protein OC835_004340 [Tilletia horrida]